MKNIAQLDRKYSLYGFPKLHKFNTQLRPMISMVGSAQHSFAKWLADILEPVVQLYSQHGISDSFTFSHQIHIYPFLPIMHSLAPFR